MMSHRPFTVAGASQGFETEKVRIILIKSCISQRKLQALTPLVSLVPTIFMVGCTVLRFDIGQVTMFLTIAMTSITLMNPIATVTLVRPYRRAVNRAFKVHTNTLAVLSSIEMSDARNQR